MSILKSLLRLIPTLISMLPIFGIIIIFVLIFLCFKNKVKIKWRTFKGKGFKPERGCFGLYVYCGKQGQGR